MQSNFIRPKNMQNVPHVCRRTKGKILTASLLFLKPDEEKVLRLGCGLLLSGQVMHALQVLFLTGKFEAVKLLRK
jgi:hypothetical protein